MQDLSTILYARIQALEERMARLDNGRNGIIVRGGDGGSGAIDYDMFFVGGRKCLEAAITGTKSNFLQINADGSAEWVAAMPDVMPTGSEVFDVTKNHIHITGATAGNI